MKHNTHCNLVIKVGRRKAYPEGTFRPWIEKIMKKLGWMFYLLDERGDIVRYSRPLKSGEQITIERKR